MPHGELRRAPDLHLRGSRFDQSRSGARRAIDNQFRKLGPGFKRPPNVAFDPIKILRVALDPAE